LIQELLYQELENNQPVFTDPPLKMKENNQAPLTNYAGIALARNLINQLNIPSLINENIHVLKRHRPYHESDHILTQVYNFLTGGEVLNDIERLQEDTALQRILGTDRIPDPTTAGDFLARFRDKELETFQEVLGTVQDTAFGMLGKKRKEVATIDSDSSIHEVYGEKKEGADYAYNHTYSYNALYITLAETGDMLHQELREGNTYSSKGTKERLPKIIERVSKHFQKVRYRGDSAFYDKDIVRVVDEGNVEFFITADQTHPLMKKVISIEEEEWKSFKHKRIGEKRRESKNRRKRKNNKKALAKKRNRVIKKKGKVQVASFYYQPTGWEKPYRFVVKRTEIREEGKQLYFDERLCKYTYYIVVTNSEATNSRVMNVAQGRGNQENLIKDVKYGLGLDHIPTGFLHANKTHFLIASLAWNIKTWLLNLARLGEGASLRFKRFLYLCVHQAAAISYTGTRTVVLRMEKGEYYSCFSKALSTIASL
jgi:hypothetical protein